MLEFYVAYKDYNWMMGFIIGKHVRKVVIEVCGKTQIDYRKTKIDFKGPYKKVPFFGSDKKRNRR